MKATTRDVGKVTVIDLNGKITIGKGDLILREAIDNALKEGKSRLLLNLEKVSYMDSAGIGELVACFKRVVEKKGILKLVNPEGRVQDLLALTKLDEYFETFQSESEALASFAA
ncbi:MAG TPA: STAS domain-containing protein [Patescibacteria group bacterium]|jgi:anti-sigma B factor antagonist|nr:STAS domain-containing protein [Patescibacteria group bacterium]